MSEIINIYLESDLSEFTTTAVDSGDLYWSADAAMAGTSGGMACLIDDTTEIYGEYQLGTASTTGTTRYRFYFDPNSLNMNSGDKFNISSVHSSSTTFVYVELYNSSGNYQIRLIYYNDAASGNSTSYYTISNDVHYIEILMERATLEDSNDGVVHLWIDGDDKQTVSNIDNYNRFNNFSKIRIGALGGIDYPTTNGTIYHDEIIVNDDGSEIGPVAPSTLSASISDGLTLGESMQSVASLGNIDVALDNANYQGKGVRII